MKSLLICTPYPLLCAW